MFTLWGITPEGFQAMEVALELISGEALYERVVQGLLLKARRSLWIATANVKDCQVELDGAFRSIVEAFERLCQRGVDVRILHSGVPSGSFLESLKEMGLAGRPNFAMRRCPRVHFKAIIADDAWLHLGSANLTGAGLGAKSAQRRNFEVGILTADQRLIERVARLFHEIWDGLRCEDCRRRNVCYVPLEEPAF